MRDSVTTTLGKLRVLCSQSSATDWLMEIAGAWYALLKEAPEPDGGISMELWTSNEDGIDGRLLGKIRIAPDGSLVAPPWLVEALA